MIDQDDVAKEVLRLQERDGVCTPAAFVEAARCEDSPLHSLFDWDDAAEAQLWREHRARQIIGRIRVDLNGTRTPAYVSVVVTKGERQQGYVPVEVAMDDDDLRRQVFAQARAGLKGWRSRLGAFHQAADALSHIDRAIESLRGKEVSDDQE